MIKGHDRVNGCWKILIGTRRFPNQNRGVTDARKIQLSNEWIATWVVSVINEPAYLNYNHLFS